AQDVTHQAIAAQENKAPAQLRLEDDDDADQDRGEQIVQNLAELGKTEAGDDRLSGQEKADDHQPQPANHARAARFAQKAQNEIDEHRQDHDLNEIPFPHHLVELRQPS